MKQFIELNIKKVTLKKLKKCKNFAKRFFFTITDHKAQVNKI